MPGPETSFYIFIGIAVLGAVIFAVAIVAANRKK